jgi:hypothetical protein
MVASSDQPVPVVPSQVPILGAGRPLGPAIQRTKTELFDVVRAGETPPDAPASVRPGHFRGCWGYFRRLLGSPPSGFARS